MGSLRVHELGRVLLFGGLGFTFTSALTAVLGLWPFWVPLLGALLMATGAVLFVGTLRR